jgi:hypothetical protein
VAKHGHGCIERDADGRGELADQLYDPCPTSLHVHQINSSSSFEIRPRKSILSYPFFFGQVSTLSTLFELIFVQDIYYPVKAPKKP